MSAALILKGWQSMMGVSLGLVVATAAVAIWCNSLGVVTVEGRTWFLMTGFPSGSLLVDRYKASFITCLISGASEGLPGCHKCPPQKNTARRRTGELTVKDDG